MKLMPASQARAKARRPASRRNAPVNQIPDRLTGLSGSHNRSHPGSKLSRSHHSSRRSSKNSSSNHNGRNSLNNSRNSLNNRRISLKISSRDNLNSRDSLRISSRDNLNSRDNLRISSRDRSSKGHRSNRASSRGICKTGASKIGASKTGNRTATNAPGPIRMISRTSPGLTTDVRSRHRRRSSHSNIRHKIMSRLVPRHSSSRCLSLTIISLPMTQ